jgi:hypothetical protein
MAFRGRENKHDIWLRFCNKHQEWLAAFGLPQAITLGEDRFRDLLRDGCAKGAGAEASLSHLSTDQWQALERFAAVFFHEFESYAPLDLFPAFRQEASRRGTGFRA